MTNKERYQRAFQALPIPETLSLEDYPMNMKKNEHPMKLRRLVLIAAVCAMVLAVTAYAADLGGVQRTMQLWLHGEQYNAVVVFDGQGHYEAAYTDASGEAHQIYGGGVSIAPDGSERPATEAELEEHLRQPRTYRDENGRMWVCWQGEKMEITERFENGVCYVELPDEGGTLYLTVKEGGGCAWSPKKFPDPNSFRVNH